MLKSISVNEKLKLPDKLPTQPTANNQSKTTLENPGQSTQVLNWILRNADVRTYAIRS